MISRRTALLLPLALGSLAACSPAADEPEGDRLAAMVPPPRGGSALGADDFATAMQSPGTVLIDVRTPQEFAAGHIEGAVNIDVSASGFETALGELDPKVPYAVYCRSGNRSAKALAVMEHLGFVSAYHLDGGIGAWTRSGRPLVTP